MLRFITRVFVNIGELSIDELTFLVRIGQHADGRGDTRDALRELVPILGADVFADLCEQTRGPLLLHVSALAL